MVLVDTGFGSVEFIHGVRKRKYHVIAGIACTRKLMDGRCVSQLHKRGQQLHLKGLKFPVQVPGTILNVMMVKQSLRRETDRQHNCNWYTLDGDRTPVPVAHTSLSGYLRGLKFERVERRGKECHKLFTTIEADRVYILESGHDSNFSKCVLSAIASLAPEQLRQPLTLQPVAGDDDAVLECRLWLGTELIKAPYDLGSDWRGISQRAIANCKTVPSYL